MNSSETIDKIILDKSTKKRARKNSQLSSAWINFTRNKSAVLGLIIFLIIITVCYTAPLYIDYDASVLTPDYSKIRQFPVEGHILGTDEMGRDMLARIIWGGRTSITISVVSLLMSMVVSITLGSVAAYYGDKIETIIMRSLDVLLAIPSILLMITLVSIMEPTVTNLTIAMAINFIPADARFIRAQVLTVKNNEYIEAAKCLGASDFRIIMSHIVPNAINPLISQFVMYVGSGILMISALSFLGMGVQPPAPEWGAMLSSGRDFIRYSWHLSAFPGLAIVLTVTSLTLVGDGLRDALDPRMKR